MIRTRFLASRWRLLRPGIGALLVVLLFPVLLVFGQQTERSATRRALDRLERALENEDGLAPETKAALQDLVVALRLLDGVRSRAGEQPADRQAAIDKRALKGAVDEYLADRLPAREKASWEMVLNRLNTYGDLRLRSESSFQLIDKPARYRARVRLRLGTNYQLTDETLIGARIVTGNPADPQSPHQTLGNVFSGFAISLDRAFLTYRPNWGNGLWVTSGKFSHPFYQNPIYSELLWDADVQPEGVVGGISFSNLGALESLNLTAGQYLLLEQSRGSDASTSVFQLGGRLRLTDRVSWNFALGYYRYSDVNPHGSTVILGHNSGNATVDADGDGEPDRFLSQFGILHPIVAFSLNQGGFPIVISGEYIKNTRARLDQDQGWSAGIALGTNRKQGDWRLYYQRQLVEQDAVFSPVSQDDFIFQTNHRSHLFGANYQLTDKVGFHSWALVSARAGGDAFHSRENSQQWRLRFDLNIKF